MPRLARKNLETTFFHIVVQGMNREYIFDKEEYIEKYLSLLRIYGKKYKIKLLAYCIMNNHAHILLYTEDIKEMSKYMKGINTSYGHYYNKVESRVGFVFRNRYVSQPIYNEKYLYSCIVYIHNNPVKASIVKEAKEYKYSSYNDYINNTGIMTNDILKLIFGTTKDYIEQFISIEEEDCKFCECREEKEDTKKIFTEYCSKTNNVVNEIMEDEKLLICAIKYLSEEKRISKTDIGKLLNINRLKVMRLLNKV